MSDITFEPYDGTKLLSMKDINGQDPELYICTSNRTAGKTTFFNRMCINRAKKKKEKFCILVRFSYALDNISEKFFGDIKELFFPTYTFTSKKKAKGQYHELYLNGIHKGYALALNSSDFVKDNSHLFNDIDFFIFDEFQSEQNKYVPNEIQKFLSIHKSIARGRGKQVRHVPVYLIGNDVSLLNPYYAELNISAKLNPYTNFLRGDGFVLEHSFNESASKAQASSGISRAFTNNNYIDFTINRKYLDDNFCFIEKPNGRGNYICTIKYLGKYYSIKEYADYGVMYCDDKIDIHFPIKISVTTSDMEINYIMLKKYDYLIKHLQGLFEHGCFRFKNLYCKEAILKTLAY